MTKNDELTYQERYDLEYAKGFRLGGIKSSREIAIRCIKDFGKSGKRLIHKINHEVDCRILRNIILMICNQSVTPEMLENIYDDLTPTKEELGVDYNGADD